MSRGDEELDFKIGQIIERVDALQHGSAKTQDYLDEFRTTLGEIHLKIQRQGDQLDQIDKRTSVLDGEKGIDNRLFMAEGQIRSHDEFIGRLKKLAWKLIGSAAVGGASAGGAAAHFYHMYFVSPS